MINIYSRREKLPTGIEIVKNGDKFFNTNVISLEEKELSIVQPIDNFKYLGNNKIETPYGICSIYELSTGAKTVINVLRNPGKIFNLDSCGGNALEILFREANRGEIDITGILTHPFFNLEDGIVLNILNEGETILIKSNLELAELYLKEDFIYD